MRWLSLVLIGVMGEVFAAWRAEVVYQWGDEYDCSMIILGKRENSDSLRLYVVLGGSRIEEITYSGGEWRVVPVCTLPAVKSIVFASVRSDSLMRMYVTTLRDSSLYELRFSEGKWERDTVIKFPEPVKGLVCTQGRNDGVKRLYTVSGGHGFELSWDDDHWVVDTAWNAISHYNDELVSAIRDDTIRIYEGARWGIGTVELTYQDGEWVKTGDWLAGTLAGDAKNDGKLRLYSLCFRVEPPYKGFCESFYSDTGWVTGLADSIDLEAVPAVIGDGRNTGKNYIYLVAQYDGEVWEREWMGEYWDTNLIYIDTSQAGYSFNSCGDPNAFGAWVVIARLRYDDTNRVYACLDRKIVELTYVPSGIEEDKEESTFESLVSFGELLFSFDRQDLPCFLNIYNSGGQLIRRERVNRSPFHLKFGNMSEGVYFCIFESSKCRRIRKIILVK